MTIPSIPTIVTGSLLVSASIFTSIAYGNTPDFGIQAAWVVLGEQGQATARVITKGAVCPNLNQDNILTAMRIRAVPPTHQRQNQSKPAIFPVLTCELPLTKGVKSVSVEGKNLPTPKAELKKIVVLGNTGCLAKRQNCDDKKAWVFSQIAREAADLEPDLIVHTGDYHYRDANPWGFGWDAWQADFFTPAAPLLAAAPWVMVRGDRETCAKAGQGWWLFLAPNPINAGDGRNCDKEVNDVIGNYSEPYAVPLGKDADGKSVQLIIFDSANLPNQGFKKDDPSYRVYLNQYQKANQLTRQADHSIFVEHHPILDFGVNPEYGAGVIYSQIAPNPYYPYAHFEGSLHYEASDGELKDNWPSTMRGFVPSNAFLQGMLKDIHPKRLFDPKVDMVLTGHVSVLNALIPKTDRPVQWVVGNGGTAPIVTLRNRKETIPRNKEHFSDSSSDSILFNDAGFLVMERSSAKSADWKMDVRNEGGTNLMTCHLRSGKMECK